MCLGFEALINAGGDGKRDILAIDLEEGDLSPSQVHAPLVEANWCKLQALLRHNSTLSVRRIKMWSDDGRRIGSRSAVAVLDSLADFIGYTDIVIDISAMPRSVYFPLIAKALYLLDETTYAPGIRLWRDSVVSVVYSEGLNSTTSSVTLQRTDRHGILGQKPADFQVSLCERPTKRSPTGPADWAVQKQRASSAAGDGPPQRPPGVLVLGNRRGPELVNTPGCGHPLYLWAQAWGGRGNDQ